MIKKNKKFQGLGYKEIAVEELYFMYEVLDVITICDGDTKEATPLSNLREEEYYNGH